MLRNSIYISIGAVVIYVLFLYITYVDKEITTGKYLGYDINMSKEMAYKAVISESRTTDIFVMYPLNENGIGTLVKFDKNIITYEYIKELDQWSLYLQDNYHNVIKLNFSEDKLIRIYRHRKYFEFP